MDKVRKLLSVLLLIAIPLGTFAQDGIHPYVEYRKRVESSQNVSPLDTGLFGEQVSLYNGATEFSTTDISIPGNNALSVQLGRRLSIELQPQNAYLPYDTRLLGLGNWDVEVPYMAAVYPASSGWSATRCSVGSVPPISVAQFNRVEYWQGINVHLPGRGNTSALGLQAATPKPSTGTYKLTTSERDVFDCIAMKSGLAGEGFRMTTSSGVRYYFDVGATRTGGRLTKYVLDHTDGMMVPIHLDRNKYYLLASKIEDRFGNTVEFEYNAGGHPARIWSNDGREILLTYISGRLSSATSHLRTWQYHYNAGGELTQVVQPDGSTWSYSYSGGLAPEAPSVTLPATPNCGYSGPALDDSYSITATHPSGAVGAFAFTNKRHFRSGVHATECVAQGNPAAPDYTLYVPYYFDVMSINSKTISGTGIAAPMTWSYAYSNNFVTLWGLPTSSPSYPCTTCVAEKTVTVTNPDNTKSRHTFGMRYQDNDGRTLKVETLRADSTVIRTETNTYMTEAQAVGQPYHGEYGSILGSISDPASARIRPVTNRTIQQDSVNFVWQSNTFDTMARPKKVTKSSGVSGSPTRTEETFYWDNTVKWVLGQVSKVNCTAPTTALPTGCGASGIEVFERTYDAVYAMPLVTERFNKVEQTLGWDTTSSLVSGQLGTAKTAADGNSYVTTISSWKRGTPQLISYPATPESPAGATQSAEVNDSGWITWVTDEAGSKTCYGYDPMGRINLITYPSETTPGVCDTSKWASTSISFAGGNPAAYGVPSGHWRQTRQTGNGRKILILDALWRPVVEQTVDLANVSGTLSEVIKRYDHDGKLVFQSYPMNTNGLAHYADPAHQGVWTAYDALNRATSVSQDSELSPSLLVTMTEYLPGFVTRVTTPKLQQTTTNYMAYDQPNSDWPIAVVHPEGAFTDITRDVFGKPTTLKRRNSASSLAITRSYTYNANQELCRSVEPETGATLTGYDAAGNLKWSSAGLAVTTACEASGTSATVAARRVDRAYDARNRVQSLSFPDTKGNQTWSYTPDGLVAQMGTTNPNFGTPITTTYTYNKRRLLTTEAANIAGGSFSQSYTYNTDGHLLTQTHANATAVSYAPNALGQPTQVGTYATGVSYYPNGALKQFTYGNGIVHSMTQNARQLPSRSTDCTVAGASCATANQRLDLGYAYDKNSNVSAITDYTSGARQTRAMTYDNLDRLTQTTSAMFGTASYAYDVLDNLTRATVGASAQVAARDHFYCYDATSWQLTFIRTSSCSGAAVTTLGYDPQGNVDYKNNADYVFDYGNRLRSAPGEWYAYDGHGRRVLSCTPSACDYQQYAANGQLSFHRDYRKGLDYVNLYLGGSLVAIREQPTAGGSALVKYQHTDALGTPIATTDATGAFIEKSEYEPYGKLANRPLTDGPGFTGHVQDAATGLTYMQQRYYDPGIGRFLSVDPVTADANTGAKFNRYLYALNNPYKFTDPDGRDDNSIYGDPSRMMAQPSGEGAGLVADFLPIIGDIKGVFEAFREPTARNIVAAGVGFVPVVGDVAGKAIKNADHLIEAAGKLDRLKGGVRQGRVEGDVDAILGSITEGGKKGAGGIVTMSDGTKIGSHTSTKTGATTIDVNKGGKVYKIRVDPPRPPKSKE